MRGEKVSPERAMYSPQELDVLVKALVVDRELALDQHVVEGRHPPRADDGDAPLLVGVEPGQVQVGDDPGREAQVAEDDVLDALAHVGGALRDALHGLLADQVQRDGDVVGAEAPQRVLVRAQLAEVQAVAVDVVEVAELLRSRSAPSGARRPGGTRAGGRPSGSCRPAGRRRRRARRPRRSSPAASRRSSACRPAPRATASSAWVGTGVASTTASRLSSASRSAMSARGARAGEGARELLPGRLGGVAQPGSARSRGWRRSCARGSGPSSRGRPRRRGRCPVRSQRPDRLHAALGRVAVAVELGMLGGRRALQGRAGPRPRRGRRACSSPPGRSRPTRCWHAGSRRAPWQGTPPSGRLRSRSAPRGRFAAGALNSM